MMKSLSNLWQKHSDVFSSVFRSVINPAEDGLKNHLLLPDIQLIPSDHVIQMFQRELQELLGHLLHLLKVLQGEDLCLMVEI